MIVGVLALLGIVAMAVFFRGSDVEMPEYVAVESDGPFEIRDYPALVIDAPNIIHTNTLTENLADIQEKDRYDVVLANPPFGGKERKDVQQNFPIRTGETAFLFTEFVTLQKTRADSPRSWSLDIATVDTATYDLSVKNPNGGRRWRTRVRRKFWIRLRSNS